MSEPLALPRKSFNPLQIYRQEFLAACLESIAKTRNCAEGNLPPQNLVARMIREMGPDLLICSEGAQEMYDALFTDGALYQKAWAAAAKRFGKSASYDPEFIFRMMARGHGEYHFIRNILYNMPSSGCGGERVEVLEDLEGVLVESASSAVLHRSLLKEYLEHLLTIFPAAEDLALVRKNIPWKSMAIVVGLGTMALVSTPTAGLAGLAIFLGLREVPSQAF